MDYMENEFDYEKIRKALFTRVMREMAEKNWSMRKLSDYSGVPYETLKKLLNSKIQNPSFASILKLAVALDCSLDYLAWGDERKPVK